MDTKRFLLAIGLTLLVLWLYQAWLEYQYPGYYDGQPVAEQDKQEPSGQAESGGKSAPAAGATPQTAEEGGTEGVPQVRADRDRPEEAAPSAAAAADPGLTVTTDKLRVVFGARSGDPIRAELLDYRQEDRPDSAPVSVLQAQGPRVVVAQSGWLAQGLPSPSHQARFAAQTSGPVTLEPGQNRVSVTFSHTANGLEFRKTYRLRRGSYEVAVGTPGTDATLAATERERFSRPPHDSRSCTKTSTPRPKRFATANWWSIRPKPSTVSVRTRALRPRSSGCTT